MIWFSQLIHIPRRLLGLYDTVAQFPWLRSTYHEQKWHSLYLAGQLSLSLRVETKAVRRRRIVSIIGNTGCVRASSIHAFNDSEIIDVKCPYRRPSKMAFAQYFGWAEPESQYSARGSAFIIIWRCSDISCTVIAYAAFHNKETSVGFLNSFLKFSDKCRIQYPWLCPPKAYIYTIDQPFLTVG